MICFLERKRNICAKCKQGTIFCFIFDKPTVILHFTYFASDVLQFVWVSADEYHVQTEPRQLQIRKFVRTKLAVWGCTAKQPLVKLGGEGSSVFKSTLLKVQQGLLTPSTNWHNVLSDLFQSDIGIPNCCCDMQNDGL